LSAIDTAIGCGIAIVGLFILYRALKEPMDLLFGFIGRGLVAFKDWITGSVPEGATVIKYG
jgi:hypothetical protein